MKKKTVLLCSVLICASLFTGCEWSVGYSYDLPNGKSGGKTYSSEDEKEEASSEEAKEVEKPETIPVADENEAFAEEDTYEPDANAWNYLGVYGNVPFSENGTSWEAFTEDGWQFSSEDGEYSFITCENEKYPGVDFYVMGREETTKAVIEEKGVFGYTFDALLADKTPDISWQGLSFGDSVEDFLAVYGEADDTYDSDDYVFLTYYLNNDTRELQFKFTKDGGLYGVQHMIF